ncbi:MAG: adenylyltransferase/cytidyltransferase family protein [Desulfobacula sp.]|uniref:PfkB family carbohydrate kinase n=1 Tax=Desulfobacula sp. TaxID=2593537 RepID=UPI0025BDFE4B|nr:PfkB family carbohydrate kinase [Desulfobacula sp.]MCD4722149.1 adenylyltransferase/cytidyltransferase family protein [Desulfobacula sp.]
MLETSSLKHLGEIRKKLPKNEKIVFVSGFFNIVHPGHLRLLRFAAECGDFLVVGVYGDSVGDSLLDENLRFDGIKAISLVDYAFILKDTSEDFIKELSPAIVVKGKEHENSFNPEADVVKSYGGKMLFSSGDISFSLVELLQDESQRIVSSSFVKNDSFMQRHGFNWLDLEKVLKKFQELKVLVVGDVIVDEYITCDPIGMSQEDPTVVVTPVGTDLFVGGAGIVAAHASNLGADVSFFSITGSDEITGFVKKKLDTAKVKARLFQDESRPTILKQRFRSSGKTLLRVNHLRQHPISQEIQKQLKSELFDVINDQDVVIFSDFNYGCLPQPLVDTIILECKKKNIMMVADSQSSSQIGDISRFIDMKLMTPTEREARLALKDFESGLVVLAEKLRKKSRAENIFITLDKEGLLIHADVTSKNNYFTDRLEAMNKNPVDPAGAGDSLLTCSALALASGSDIWQSAYLGSVAAACQVSRNGNIPLSANDMYFGTRS